jgi:hypothetical protein
MALTDMMGFYGGSTGRTGTSTGDRNYNAYDPANTGGVQFDYGPTNTAQTLATGTAKSNLAAAPDIARISSLINALNSAQQQALNKSRLGAPGQAIQDQILANTAAGARGELTPSELRTLQASTAESSGGRGFGVDSPSGYADFTNRYLRTQYERQQDALDNLTKLYADNPAAPLYNAGENVVAPQTYAAAQSAEANRALEAQRLQQQANQFAQQMQLQQAQFAQQQRAYNDTQRAKQPLGIGPTGSVVAGGGDSMGYFDVMGRWHTGKPIGVGGF